MIASAQGGLLFFSIGAGRAIGYNATMRTTKYWQGFWRLADPKISLASFAGIFMAACFAAADGEIHAGWLLITVLGIFCVEIAKNALGDIVDFDSGTDQAVGIEDRSPFSGGKRVMVDGLLSRTQTRDIAAACFIAAIAIGLAISIFRDTRILVFGLAGIALAFFYHGGPLKLAYRGLGEFAVAVAYGPLVVGGTYLVQAGYLNALLIQVSMAFGTLVAAFLWINEFPDYHAPGMLWGGLGAVPAAFSAWRLLTSHGVTHQVIPAQAASLLSFILMACGSGLGYWLSA
jgi:1,4-dihydroxy-2-naphthoate octaprenyltransferase